MLRNGGILALAMGDVNRERPVLTEIATKSHSRLIVANPGRRTWFLGEGGNGAGGGYRIDEKRKAWGPGVATLDGFRQTG